MYLSISNIAWGAENDNRMYSLMQKYGFTGLEIAPTRIFPENPYYRLKEAEVWSKKLDSDYGLVVPSIQSIWFGRTEKLFGSEDERAALAEYTKKAIDFAAAIGCENLVFGCPKNRYIPDDANIEIAVAFFKTVGDYAAERGTVIGMEANPTIYGTNFINDTVSALELINQVNSPGFRLNLDVGTMVQNNESVNELIGQVKFINHVHISEPGLKSIEERTIIHTELKRLLKDEGYNGFISIEMGRHDDIKIIENAMEYVKGIFG